MARRGCKYEKDKFCYICGHFINKSSRQYSLISNPKLSEAYDKYFGLNIKQDIGKSWAPEFSCPSCYSILLGWLSGSRKKMPFAIPRVWREPEDHDNDCFFCLATIGTGRVKSVYPDLPSSRAPIKHDQDLPIPMPPPNDSSHSSDGNSTTSSDENLHLQCDPSYRVEKSINIVTRDKFDEYVKRLGLSKLGSEEFRKILNEIGVLEDSVTYRNVRDRHEEYSEYFTETKDYCFCNDITQFFNSLVGTYNSDDFMLFLDGSVSGLKVALLKTDGSIPPIPVAQWTNAKECYSVVSKVMEDLKYDEQKWKVCGDFKVSEFKILLILHFWEIFLKYLPIWYHFYFFRCCNCLWVSMYREIFAILVYFVSSMLKAMNVTLAQNGTRGTEPSSVSTVL